MPDLSSIAWNRARTVHYPLGEDNEVEVMSSIGAPDRLPTWQITLQKWPRNPRDSPSVP